MKTCPRCKTSKPFYEFAKHSRRADGLQSQCKDCKHKTDQEYYQKNVEKITARVSTPEARRRQRARKYSISEENVKELELRSGGFCEICKVAVATCIDHCHKTNQVRGLLCGACNKGLGFFGDDAARLAAAAVYLQV